LLTGIRASLFRQVAREQGIELKVIKLSGTKKGFVPFSRRRVVQRRFSWLIRVRRLACDFRKWVAAAIAPLSVPEARCA
jgi:hypothetical protein